jgi:hypothetical protein
MNNRLVIGVLTPLSLDDAASGARFLELLIQTAPDLSPEYFGNVEPVRTPFQSIEESVASWKPPFLWKRRTGVRTDGAVWFGNPGNHSATYVTVTGRCQPTDQAVALVQAATAPFSVDFAYVHLVTEAETTAPQVPYDMWYPIDIGVTSHDLRKGIPSICWAMVFGPPYVRLIGREKLLSAPCFSVKELSNEHLYLQVTAQVEDLRRDFGGFEALRQRLKRHLGEELFLEPSGTVARAVPEFRL